MAKCDDQIHEALGRKATKRELGAIYRDAGNLADKIKAVKDDPTAVRGVLQAFTDDLKAQRATARRNAALNYLAHKTLTDWRRGLEMDKVPAGDILGAMTHGSLLDFHGAKDHVLGNISRAVLARQGAFWTDLDAKGATAYARDPNTQLSIGKAKWDLQHGVDPAKVKADYGQHAFDVAQTMRDHENAVIANLNRWGATIGKNPKNIVPRMIDANKVAKAGGAKWGDGYAAWKADVARMDWAESFDGKYLNNEAGRETLLRSLYDQFLTGKHLTFGGMDEMAGRGVANVGKRRSHSREIVFSRPEDEINYLLKYGRGNNLAEQAGYWMEGGERDAQIMRKFGPNPTQTYKQFVETWAKDLNRRGESLDALNKADKYQRSVIWPAILDETGHPNANLAAKFLMASRGAFVTAAKISLSMLTSFAGDPVARAAQSRYYGARTITEGTAGYFKAASALFKGVNSTEARRIAADAGVRFQDIHRPMGLTPEDEFGLGGAARFAQYALKWGGHSFLSNRFHVNWLTADGMADAHLSDTAFEALPEGFRAGLNQFGIDAKSWDVMRQMEKTDVKAGKIFQPGNIRAMDLAAFKPLVADEAPSDAQLARAREVLADRYRNFLGERASGATSDPDLGLRAQVLGGTLRNTVSGEAWRSALMLKAWTLKYMRNGLGREIYGYGIEKDPLPVAIWRTLTKNGTRGGREGLAAMIGMGIIAGLIRNALYDVANGKTPEDAFDPKNATHAFTRAVAFQSLGLLTDFVFDESRKNTDHPQTAADRIIGLMGPAVENPAELFDMAHTAARQIASGKFNEKNRNKDLANAVNFLYQNTPNTLWSKYALQHLVVNNLMEALNPGYKARLEKRARQHGQTYLMGSP